MINRIVAGILMLTLLQGCNLNRQKPNFEPIQNMMEQSAVKPQEPETFFPDGIGSRLPPENTIPVGFKPYLYGMDFSKAELENSNPLQSNMNPDVLKVGQKQFETHCAVCHGYKALGDGPVSPKFPLKIPPLVSEKVKGWTDGRIYHVITMGQGVMNSYASHVPQSERWQLVNYIRNLQKGGN